MLLFLRRFVILVLGLLLLAAPTLVRENYWQYNDRPYTPPTVPDLAVAATPVPTPTAVPLAEVAFEAVGELRAGPVVVDLAHSNFLDPSGMQPLADALADQGIGLRYWLSTIDPLTVNSYLEYPDQSTELAAQLADASALIVISPFFLWTAQEIAVAEQFVTRGGRLLLISDPDIMGDYAAATNMIGEPFGVVFNEDYLYDTALNDGNFTYFFQESLLLPTENTETSSAPLTDSTIAFYGGRSLSGDLRPLLQSVETTLSSLRVGRSGFTTAAIAGLAERGTAGRVLALSDFDVLTEPYRQRHDNQRMVEYVAGFLSADERINRVVDFPHYLGKEVALAFGASDAINAELILQGAQLQQRLEQSGRTLFLTDSSTLTGTLSINSADGTLLSDSADGTIPSDSADGTIPSDSASGETDPVATAAPDSAAATDLIYLAAYTTALSQTTVLDELGIELYTEVVTKSVPVATPTVRVDAMPPAPQGEGTEQPADRTPGVETGDVGDTLPAPATPPPPLTGTVPITALQRVAQVDETPPVTTTDLITGSASITDSIAVTSSVGITEGANGESETPTPSVTRAITPSATLTATAAVEERTFITTYLRTAGGLTFLADETVLVVRQPQAGDRLLLAVLATNSRGLDAGVNRLLENDFSGCVIGEVLTFCALNGTGDATSTAGTTAEPLAEEAPPAEQDEEAPIEPGNEPPRGVDAPVLLIDDNGAAAADELSEADTYLQRLLAAGYQVDLWSVGDQGDPTVDDLLAYGWVIWSNGGYAAGAIDNDDLDTIFTFISESGRLTISSRTPLPGLEATSAIRDLVVAPDAAPPLIEGLPAEPVVLTGAEMSSAVLNALAEEDPATEVVLRRGPASEDSEAPALVVLADPAMGDSEARLMIAAFSVDWLPDAEQATLIDNMATWMLTP